jgi:DNA-directed RNA polymerase specialized sigma24 family protein
MLPIVLCPPAIVRPLNDQHAAFDRLYPAISAMTRDAFRDVPCPHDRDDLFAEVLAKAWEHVRKWPSVSPAGPGSRL